MKHLRVCILLVTFALISFPIATGQDNSTPKQARLASLPDNPCEVLSVEQVAAAIGLEVTSAKRSPSIKESVRTERENQEPEPGSICSYETLSDFGAIVIYVPIRADRRAAEYWKTRAKYFEAFPGSAQFVPDLGTDAWLAAGKTLHVLIREDEYFSVSTQMYQPGSRELLVKIARVMLGQL